LTTLPNACVYWCRVVAATRDRAAADREVELGRAALLAAGTS
jgi:hypothetical protein